LLLLSAVGCWRERPPTIAPIELAVVEPLSATSCPPTTVEPSNAPPPRISGALEIIRVEGTPHLWLDARDASAWSHDNRHVAVSDGGIISLWQAFDGSFERVVNASEPVSLDVATIQWSNDDRSLLLSENSRGFDRASAVIPIERDAIGWLHFWNQRREDTTRFGALTLARRGPMTVELGATGTLRLRTATACFELGPGWTTDIVTFSPDGSSFFVEHGKGEARWMVQRSSADGRAIRARKVEGGGRLVAVPARDQIYILFDDWLQLAEWSTGRILRERPPPDVTETVHGDYDFFASANPDRPGGSTGIILASHEGGFLVGESRFGLGQAISIWHVGTAEPSRRISIGRSIERFALSPDERSIAVGSTHGFVEVRDRTNGKTRSSHQQLGAIVALAFSPDGTQLASASRDGSVVVMSTATGKVLGTLQLQSDRASILTWTDASTLVVDTQRGQAVTLR
jgi:WD40 repeat protein